MNEYNFSNRMKSLNGTATREILKLLSRPEIISFAGGLPAKEGLPVEIIREITDYILSSDYAKVVLQYGTTEGNPLLLSGGIEYLNSLGLKPQSNQVMTISGAQQGIDLAFKAFVNEGDNILVQDPTYLAVIQIAQSYCGNVYGVKSNSDGLDLEDLEAKIKQYKPKMLYVVPTFANPTGETYTEQNRKQICQICAKYNVIILEDDPYSRLRFEGSHVLPLKAFDEHDNVIFLASFSKVISPGLRTGVAYGNEQVIRKMVIGKQGTDLHTSNMSQAIVAEYLKRGLLYPHIQSSLPVYKSRKDAMKKAIEKYMPQEFVCTNPEGGLFFWGTLPEHINTVKLLPKAIEHNVAYIQGQVFYADGKGLNTLRLNYSNVNAEQIDKGIKILAQLLKEEISNKVHG